MADHSQRVLNATQRFFQKAQKIDSPTKRKRAKSKYPTEEQEQLWLVADLRKAELLFQHCPMGIAARSPVAGARMKRMGAHKGFPDLAVFTRAPRFPHAPGVIIELKRAKPAPSRVSVEQKEWMRQLTELGWVCKVCFGYLDALEFLRNQCGYKIGDPNDNLLKDDARDDSQ